MRVRILLDNGYFYPQRKKWFLWDYFWVDSDSNHYDDYSLTHTRFSTLEEAEQFLVYEDEKLQVQKAHEKKIKERPKAVVIKEYEIGGR